MSTYVMRKGVFMPIEEAPPLIQVFGRGPAVISDAMDATRHMADGKMYTSKSEFRKATRANGCVEVGNETAHLLKPRKAVPLSQQKRRDDIRRAVSDLQQAMPRKRARKRAV